MAETPGWGPAPLRGAAYAGLGRHQPLPALEEGAEWRAALRPVPVPEPGAGARTTGRSGPGTELWPPPGRRRQHSRGGGPSAGDGRGPRAPLSAAGPAPAPGARRRLRPFRPVTLAPDARSARGAPEAEGVAPRPLPRKRLPGARLPWRSPRTCSPCRSCSGPTRAAASSRRTGPRCTRWPGAAAAAGSPRAPSTRRPASSCWRRTGW